MTTFGATVRFLRQQRQLSQTELGALIGVSHPAISHWESDADRPRRATLPRLAEALGCSLTDLTNGVAWPMPPTIDERIAALERRIGEQDRRIADLEQRLRWRETTP